MYLQFGSSSRQILFWHYIQILDYLKSVAFITCMRLSKFPHHRKLLNTIENFRRRCLFIGRVVDYCDHRLFKGQSHIYVIVSPFSARWYLGNVLEIMDCENVSILVVFAEVEKPRQCINLWGGTSQDSGCCCFCLFCNVAAIMKYRLLRRIV